jgi:hypothetical protein
MWGPDFKAKRQKILMLLSLQGKMKSVNPLTPSPQKYGSHTIDLNKSNNNSNCIASSLNASGGGSNRIAWLILFFFALKYLYCFIFKNSGV